FGQGRPVWVDDPHFNAGYHVRHTALPSPGGDEELRRLTGRVFSQELDRSKPLWELWLVEGLSDDRFALLSKTHHSLVDGISGVDIITVLFDTSPDPMPVAPPDHEWVPKPIGPHRRFTWIRGDLAQFKAVKNELGGTVNDVVLAVVSGALGEYMRLQGEDTEGVELRAMVPMSTRADVERGALGNRVTAMWAPLPVGITDPVRRLNTISAAMRELKESGQAVGAEVLTRLSGFAPPTIVHQAARLAARQRLFNLVVTNVPGPQLPLYLLGRRLEAIFPMVPLTSNTALGIAIMSYNGQLNFGLTTDYDGVPDVETLVDELRSSIEEIAAA